MIHLLEKSRHINNLLQRSGGHIDFNEIAAVLSKTIEANIYLVNEKGKILGYKFMDDFECDIMLAEVIDKEHFPYDYNKGILNVEQTRPNIGQREGLCLFKENTTCIFHEKITTIVPINGGGKRLGTLILSRFSLDFLEDDIFLAEYGATVVGMEILWEKTKNLEKKAREIAAAVLALKSLSLSELDAVEKIFFELEKKSKEEKKDRHDGILVASKIAESIDITKSIIVNALRKLASAGIIESRSLGMRGTYIKVLNNRIMDEIKKR